MSALAGQLARAAHGFGLLASALFARLFIVHVPLHFAERALALHLLLQRLEGLIDVVVADENLNQRSLSYHPFPLGLPDIRRRRTDKSLATRRAKALRVERGEISEPEGDVHGGQAENRPLIWVPWPM